MRRPGISRLFSYLQHPNGTTIWGKSRCQSKAVQDHLLLGLRDPSLLEEVILSRIKEVKKQKYHCQDKWPAIQKQIQEGDLFFLVNQFQILEQEYG